MDGSFAMIDLPIIRNALTAMAHGDQPDAIIAAISLGFEKAVPGTICGVTMLDRTAQHFEHAVFPSLPAAYASALAGIKVEDRPGSCALAIYNGETVEVTDVAHDARFADIWCDLSLANGMEQVLSIPALQREGVAIGTFVVAQKGGTRLTAQQRLDADDYAALCGEILAYRQHRANHELLVGELQHRVGNIFATIGALVYATLNRYPDAGGFREVFDARLQALSRAHSLTLRTGETDLRGLVRDTLAPYALDHELKIDGPDVMLTRDSAVALSMALHELATNAAKYGSLSAEDGRLSVSWEVGEGPEGPFAMEWAESDGPPVAPPTRSGFGERTIKYSLSSAFEGKVDVHYRSEGLVCRIKAPRSDRLGQRVH